ncbi:FecR family protein [Methylotenera versatilis]|uniref:FecR family protein n=1 Tax=Methylotenera versatilis TaxID=1055487 RepID=UPI00064745CD|nr:FecR domain-containing protein [Methylotenera versatilis]
MLNKHQQIRKEAAKWFARMQYAEADHPERSTFEAWLMQSHVHADEYLAISAAWNDFDSSSRINALAQAMLRKKDNAQASRKKLMRIAGKSLAIAAIGLFSFFGYQAWQSQPIMNLASNTPVGRINQQALEDGSKLTLNANTDVEVIYYRNKRLVKLKRGEAIFDVVKDVNRPFIVESQFARVTVLGTRFVVNQIDGRVIVSVDHGKVKVENLNATDTVPVLITNGQVAEIKSGTQAIKLNRNAADAFAFLDGKLIFNAASLNEIAESLSRYRKKPIVAAQQADSPQAGMQPHITAVLDIAEMENFLKLMPQIAAVHVKNTPEKTELSAKN